MPACAFSTPRAPVAPRVAVNLTYGLPPPITGCIWKQLLVTVEQTLARKTQWKAHGFRGLRPARRLFPEVKLIVHTVMPSA